MDECSESPGVPDQTRQIRECAAVLTIPRLVEIARERHVTQIVLGQPARSHWEELLRGSIINRLLRMSTDIDIHLVPRSRNELEGM